MAVETETGLGGKVCGRTCDELMPVGLQSALSNATDVTGSYGQPRVEVCPALCQNMLGQPLCNCVTQSEEETTGVDWTDICKAFCVSDNYVLRGCPACDPNTITSITPHGALRVLNTSEGWVAWCNAQCRQGQGGAACNCDRAPL